MFQIAALFFEVQMGQSALNISQLTLESINEFTKFIDQIMNAMMNPTNLSTTFNMDQFNSMFNNLETWVEQQWGATFQQWLVYCYIYYINPTRKYY